MLFSRKDSEQAVRVHTFLHVPYEDVGSMKPVLKAFGAKVTSTRFFENELPPEADSYDMLIVMGGPMGVYDEAEFPWLQAEKGALKSALAAGKSVLGICLGSQLMAEALGGRVTQNPVKEIGWHSVSRLPGVTSWAASLFPERFLTFHWHGDTFSLPAGATPLFRSEGCANQGFAWGDNAVALQFHPEITPAVASTWVEHGGLDLSPGPYVQNPGEMLGHPKAFKQNNLWMAELCRELMRRSGGASGPGRE